jgi:hypothetical protein
MITAAEVADAYSVVAEVARDYAAALRAEPLDLERCADLSQRLGVVSQCAVTVALSWMSALLAANGRPVVE